MGAQTRLVWPAGHGLRRIPVTDPTPVYPHSLLWHRDNPHPALATLRAHLAATAAGHDAAGTWTPNWVARPRPCPPERAVRMTSPLFDGVMAGVSGYVLKQIHGWVLVGAVRCGAVRCGAVRCGAVRAVAGGHSLLAPRPRPRCGSCGPTGLPAPSAEAGAAGCQASASVVAHDTGEAFRGTR
ncbi:hypothetical protein ABGB08_11385 [Acrocarpospora sp. B8E8]